jgi:AcrR family transcriptional regulator
MNAKTPRRGAPRWGEPSARERLVKTVIELFYQEGVRAIGIDMVVEQSGVSKSSLYRTFASKDELIAAFAEEQNRRFWQWWDETVRRFDGAPRAQINALLAGVADQIGAPSFAAVPLSISPPNFPAVSIPAPRLRAATRRKCAGACATSAARSAPATRAGSASSWPF